MRTRTLVLGTVLGLVVTTILLGWVFRYRYEHVRQGETDLLLRINRFTSSTEALWQGRWRRVDGTGDLGKQPTPTPRPAPEWMPISEASKIAVRSGRFALGSAEVIIYNGSSWQLTEIVANIEIYNSWTRNDDVVLSQRPFRTTCSIPPLSIGVATFSTGLFPDARWEAEKYFKIRAVVTNAAGFPR